MDPICEGFFFHNTWFILLEKHKIMRYSHGLHVQCLIVASTEMSSIETKIPEFME